MRNGDRGCYDPIMHTPTVGGACLHQTHCDQLDNTECVKDPEETVCRCVKDFTPRQPEEDTHLVLGCDMLANEELEDIESCRHNFFIENNRVTDFWKISILRFLSKNHS